MDDAWMYDVWMRQKRKWHKKIDQTQYINQKRAKDWPISSRESTMWTAGYQWLQILICLQKYYKLLKMTQQEKRKQRKGSNSQQDSNSESEGQLDQEDGEFDSFIADEEEIQDDYYVPRRRDDSSESGRKKSKKQRKKEKKKLRRMREQESQLDEGDLDVLEQQQIEGGRLNRLKKKTEVKKRDDYSEGEQDEEQGINDIDDDDGQEQEENRFVGTHRDDQSDDSGLNQRLQDQGGDIFQPQDQKRFFQQQQDRDIINMDIPERYYYQVRNHAKSHNISIEQAIKIFQQEDRNAEAKWIYSKGRFLGGDQRQIKEKIRLVLQMLHREKVEIMYIYYYRRKAYGDVLSREDLWKIYKLDQEWFVFKDQFVHLRDNLMNVIYSFQQMPSLENMIQKTVELRELKYFKEFESFKLLENKVGSKKNFRNEIITQVRGKGIDEWLKKSDAFLSPQNLCYNLTRRSHQKKAKNPLFQPREQLQRVLRSNNPQNDKICFPLLIQDKRIQTICHYLQLQLFSHPQLRKYLKQQYYRHLVISTTPTLKGQQDINLYSQYFPVKKIRDKPIQTLPKQLWILAQQAQKKELVNMELRFSWEESGVEQRTFKGDKVFENITKYYYEITVSKEGEVWNLFRRQVVVKMLTDFFFPAFFKEVKEELTRDGEEIIIQNICDNFKKKLLVPPNHQRMLSMVLQDKKLGIVYVDQAGKPHSPLQITLVNDQELKKFANDEIIRKYIQDFKPELICIAANCRRAQTLRNAIRAIRDSNMNEDIPFPFCSLYPYEIPNLVAKQKKIEGSTEDITVLEAISMARFLRNPIIETLSLWSHNIKENGILSMNLHPCQSFVDQRKLMNALQYVSIEAVNLIGVDINQLIKLKDDNSRKILQFVCGFGPRKAFDFYERLQSLEVTHRGQLKEIMSGEVVYKNCAPFFKVQTQAHRALLKTDKEKKKQKNDSINLLDTTRIPPEWYEITQDLILKAIKNLSLDMRQRKIYSNFEEKTIALLEMFKDPSKVNSIQFIFKREQSSFYDDKLIRDEIITRFKMPVVERYEFNEEEMFYSLLRETKQTIKKYMIVTAKILSANEKFLNVVIPENGLFGSIRIFMPRNQERRPEYQRGDYIKAVITGFPFQHSFESRPRNPDDQELLKVDMMLSFPHKNEVKDHDINCFDTCFKGIVKELHPLIDLERFDLKKEDRPVIEVREDSSSRPIKTEFRKISHKKYKNLAVGPAIELIKNSPIGDFVIRPSSEGQEYLNITWHFFSGIIAHIKLKSQQKSISTSAPVYRIVSDKDNKAYESLDKVIDEYITPMNSLVQDVTSNRKFVAEPVEKIEQKAKIEMGKDPSLIHYFFGCSPKYPQYFMLVYMYREKKPVKELIKVKSTGLHFHDQVFSNIRELITWFKGHFKEKDYQSFVKKFSIKQ